MTDRVVARCPACQRWCAVEVEASPEEVRFCPWCGAEGLSAKTYGYGPGSPADPAQLPTDPVDSPPAPS